MNFIQKSLLGLSFLGLGVLPSIAKESPNVNIIPERFKSQFSFMNKDAFERMVNYEANKESIDDVFSNSIKENSTLPQDNVSVNLDFALANGYYFSIGPLTGDSDDPYERLQSKSVFQVNASATIGKFTYFNWGSYSIRRDKLEEADMGINYSLPSLSFNLGKQNFNLESTLGFMAFFYPGGAYDPIENPNGSKAGGATDVLPNVNLNLSTQVVPGKTSSLNVFYMHDIVKNAVQNGGGLMLNFSQDLKKIGFVDVKGNIYAAFGTDLYEFNGFLVSRFGLEASVPVGQNATLRGKFSKQFGSKNYRSSISNDGIASVSLNINL